MRGMIDVHCHILPGVDDGAKTGKEAVAMLLEEKKQGVGKIILTPHYRGGMFETPSKIVRQRFQKLCEINEKLGIGMKLYLGCEYHNATHMTEDLLQGERPTLAGSRYVLLEFSHRDTCAAMRKAVYELVVKGFVPILAHVERYPELMKDLGAAEELIRLGAKFQVTAGAVYGAHGFRYKQTCKKLITNDFVHFIATDAHSMRKRIPDLEQCAKYIEKKKGSVYARRILVEHPEVILADGEARDE